MPPHRRKYTPEERADIIARIAAGQTQAQVTADLGVPSGSVALLAAPAQDLINSADYRFVVLAAAQRYAAKSWRTLDTMLDLLGDREWLEAHPDMVFGVASAHRVLAETLGRILAATGRGDD